MARSWHRRVYALDGLRGLLATVVLLTHCIDRTGFIIDPTMALAFAERGGCAGSGAAADMSELRSVAYLCQLLNRRLC